jgi:hypothetical protein
MSEFLGAIGENDEPDPATPDNEMEDGLQVGLWIVGRLLRW